MKSLTIKSAVNLLQQECVDVVWFHWQWPGNVNKQTHNCLEIFKYCTRCNINRGISAEKKPELLRLWQENRVFIYSRFPIGYSKRLIEEMDPQGLSAATMPRFQISLLCFRQTFFILLTTTPVRYIWWGKNTFFSSFKMKYRRSTKLIFVFAF